MKLDAIRKPLASLGVMFGLLLSAQAHAVIIIRDANGGCRFCIGSRAACAELCGSTRQVSAYSDHMALELSDGTVAEGNTVTLSEIKGGSAIVEMMKGDTTVFKERVDLEKTALRDLENGQVNTLARLVGLTCE